MKADRGSRRPPSPLDPAGPGDSYWEDPERRRLLEELARQLSGDRPRFRLLERLRVMLRRSRSGAP